MVEIGKAGRCNPFGLLLSGGLDFATPGATVGPSLRSTPSKTASAALAPNSGALSATNATE
jgi:hypothetical protein